MKDIIIQIIKDACALDEDIEIDSSFDVLSIDSLTFISVIVRIEEVFNIEFDLNQLDIKKWKKVKDLICIIEELCYEKENIGNKAV